MNAELLANGRGVRVRTVDLSTSTRQRIKRATKCDALVLIGLEMALKDGHERALGLPQMS